MTNSQESDSIAEKPEVVQTEAKSNRRNWKTVIAVTLTAAVNVVSLGSALVQTVRQRLNQWNWRQKTALVTALAITAAGNFVYQYKVNAAWPAIIAASYGTDFFVKLFTGYAITYGLNAAFDSSILKETAVADSDTGCTATENISNGIITTATRPPAMAARTDAPSTLKPWPINSKRTTPAAPTPV